MRNLTGVYLHEYHHVSTGTRITIQKISHGTTTFRPLVRATRTHTHVGEAHSTIIPQSTHCTRCHMRLENGSESGQT